MNPLIPTHYAPFQSLEFFFCIKNSWKSSKTFESCMSEFGIPWVVTPKSLLFSCQKYCRYRRVQRENPPRLLYKDEKPAVTVLIFFPREDALFQNWVIWKRDEKAGSFRSGKSLCRKPFTHSHPKATLQHLVNYSGRWIFKVCCNQMMWYMASCLYLSPYWFGFIHLEVDLSGSKKDRPVVLRSSSLPFFKATLGSIWLQELKEHSFIWRILARYLNGPYSTNQLQWNVFCVGFEYCLLGKCNWMIFYQVTSERSNHIVRTPAIAAVSMLFKAFKQNERWKILIGLHIFGNTAKEPKMECRVKPAHQVDGFDGENGLTLKKRLAIDGRLYGQSVSLTEERCKHIQYSVGEALLKRELLSQTHQVRRSCWQNPRSGRTKKWYTVIYRLIQYILYNMLLLFLYWLKSFWLCCCFTLASIES